MKFREILEHIFLLIQPTNINLLSELFKFIVAGDEGGALVFGEGGGVGVSVGDIAVYFEAGGDLCQRPVSVDELYPDIG
jgi:hypothetical protein